MHRALAFLEATDRERPPPERLLPAVLLLKATALALREVPQLNGFWIDGGFRPGPGIHLGWAIALRGGGLVARPVVQVSLAADHRASDGHLASRFLAAIADHLQRPENL
jgi:hypothetical protein